MPDTLDGCSQKLAQAHRVEEHLLRLVPVQELVLLGFEVWLDGKAFDHATLTGDRAAALEVSALEFTTQPTWGRLLRAIARQSRHDFINKF